MQSKITVNNVNGTEIMKPKVLEIEAYTITETSKLLGYKSTKTIYRLLSRDILKDYVYLEKSGRIYLILESPNLVPKGLHREDVLNAMATIVGYADKMDSLSGLTTPTAQDQRDAVKIQYLKVLESFTRNKPWLNELFYSVFVPLIGESWLAKYDAGNVSPDMGVLV